MFVRSEKSIKEFMRLYPIVSSLVIIYAVLWLITDFLPVQFGRELMYWGIGHNLLIHEGQYWRIFTATFLHGGFTHLLFNSFSLVLFGPALEQMLGKYKFILAYFAAGILGNVATYAINPLGDYAHLGASGAIYGLFGIYIFMIFFRKHLIDQANAQIILMISLFGLVMTFIQPGINVYAHLFGFIAGIIIAPIVLVHAKPFYTIQNRTFEHDSNVQFDPNRWNKKRMSKKKKSTVLWIILGILVLLGLSSKL